MRLCMSPIRLSVVMDDKKEHRYAPLEGSSRRTRLTTILTSLSLNQPLGRYHVLVSTAEAGIKNQAAMMIVSIVESNMGSLMRESSQ